MPLHFYFGLQTKHGELYVNGDAYNPTEASSKQIPYIELTIQTQNKKESRLSGLIHTWTRARKSMMPE